MNHLTTLIIFWGITDADDNFFGNLGDGSRSQELVEEGWCEIEGSGWVEWLMLLIYEQRLVNDAVDNFFEFWKGLEGFAPDRTFNVFPNNNFITLRCFHEV